MKEKILLNMRKSLLAEKRLGYTNSGVLGGFAKYCLQALRHLNINDPEITNSLNEYLSLTRQERAELVKILFSAVNTTQDLIKIEATSVIGSKIEGKSVIPSPKSQNNPLTLPIKLIKNVGPKRAKTFEKLGIFTVKDLLWHFPRRYEDRSKIKAISQLTNGETITIKGIVTNWEEVKPRKGLTIYKAAISDGTGIAEAIWFNQAQVKNTLVRGTNILINGKAEIKYGRRQLIVSEYEIYDGMDALHTARIVPIYPGTEKLSQKLLRNIIFQSIKDFSSEILDPLPQWLIIKENLLAKNKALYIIHFPEKEKELIQARTRLALEELIVLQIGLQLSKNEQKTLGEAIKHVYDNNQIIKTFLEGLPFKLTNAQKRVIKEISSDMEGNIIMHRLVQGDVGSGKTIVAAFGLVKTFAGGFQGAMMAPTEILAEQHYLSLKEIFTPLGIKIALLSGSTPKGEKEESLRQIANNNIHIVIGTHALIQENVVFDNLGLVVIDEQHRFGVKQRAVLQNKGRNPDLLVMTATPIPRTLAMTLYGDMDVSVIDELPPERKPITTYHITESKKDKLYKFISNEINRGRQAYVVCPLIEESEALDLQNATELAVEYQNDIFPQFKVGLLHGRLKQAEKDLIMQKFRENDIQILVSTTVIEVGVNIPNATMMVIQDAQRFGLAQLHQLRGRVGRSPEKSYCFLVCNSKSQDGNARIKIMTETNDGFKLAEEDLRLRGPGELLGTKQHGLPDLKVADLINDWQLLLHAKKIVKEILDKDKKLENIENQILKNEVIEKFNNLSWRS